MKKLISILIVSISLVACGTKKTKDSEKSVYSPESVMASVVSDSDVKFSDPARIGGSSFGEFFISMLRTQNYAMALKFTSKGSIEKNGISKVTDLYQNYKFNYKLIQKSESVKGDTIMLVYVTTEYATSKFKKMTVVVENDSCKLVLSKNIDDFLK